MNPYEMKSPVKKQSQRKVEQRNTMQEKLQYAKNLIKIIEMDKSIDLIDAMFGFILGRSAIPLHQNIAVQLRQKFTALQEIYRDGMITKENIALIVVDALQYRRADQSKTQKEKNIRFVGTFTYNLEEVMMNSKFIIDKWEKQKRVDEQNQKNQLAFQKFLEDEKRNALKEAQEAEAKGWECPVCCSEIDRNFFGLLQCGHIFHPECINGYLKSKIESNQIQISCPMDNCKHSLEANEILSYIDGQLLQKYETFSFNQFVQKNNSSTSWCPTAGCQAVFQFDAALDNYRCPACKKHYCLRCRCDYHVGMTCQQYRINNSFDKNDEAFIKFAQGAKFKQCPKCKYWVERNTGCPTMTCKCGQQFCYDCGGTGCPHGSCSNSGRNLPPLIMPSMRAPPNPIMKR